MIDGFNHIEVKSLCSSKNAAKNEMTNHTLGDDIEDTSIRGERLEFPLQKDLHKRSCDL